jgi:ABC-type nitrate/sulfonate/bicarbonate transport system substrate-binding protein
MLNRRHFLGTATAGASLLGAPAIVNAQGGEPFTFMTPFGFIPDFIEMMNMVSGGHLQRQGFNPRLLGGQGTATAIQQLMAGTASFVRVTAIDQFLAVARQNAPLVTVSTLYQGSTFQLVSLRDRPIRDAADLRGKTVGIVSVGGSTDLLLNIMLQKAGLRVEDVRKEVTGNSPGALQLVRQGRVDCFFCAIGVVVTLQRANEPISVMSTDRYAPMPSQIFVTTRDYLQRNADQALRFMRAYRASCDEVMNGDKRAIFQRAGRDFEIPGIRDLDTVVSLIDISIRDLWLSEGRENLYRNVPRLWTEADRSIRGAGIAAVPNVEALYTNDFIDRSRA